MRYPAIPSKLFVDRRKSFAGKMIPGSIAIFCSNDPMPRNGDQCYPFRQDSHLFALSGLDQPGTIIVLCPNATNPAYKEIAFIMPQDREHEVWNGKRFSVKEARQISGISTILTLNQWDKIIPLLLKKSHTIYSHPRHHDRLETQILSQNDRMDAELRRLYPNHNFLSSPVILRDQFMIKHLIELGLMKNAIAVSGFAFDKVLKTMKPGLKEFEVEAELTHMLTKYGCQHAFEPIVASGKSACTLHYIKNDRIIKSGDLVLIDFGAEYACMASDMTRTIPSSGRFTKRQREIYMAVWRILKEITLMMRPGITLEQLNLETGKRIESELIHLKIVTRQDIRRQDKASPIRKKYFMHGISHHLGFDVHDIHDRSVPLKAGMVLTCEPGLYIPEEKIGIRLENDILITRGQPKNLMESIPIDPDEIESIMGSL